MYYGTPRKRQISIGDQLIWVDSRQEENLLRWLEANGFSGRWRRLEQGLNYNQSNYTPDLELSVELDNGTYRALVESKPYKAAFTPYISRRMRGVAKHYFTNLLLLYVHDKKQWYRVDIKTGELTNFGTPTPGAKLIHELYKPFTIKAPRTRSHFYRKRPQFAKLGLKVLADILEFGVQLVFSPPKTRRKRRRR